MSYFEKVVVWVCVHGSRIQYNMIFLLFAYMIF